MTPPTPPISDEVLRGWAKDTILTRPEQVQEVLDDRAALAIAFLALRAAAAKLERAADAVNLDACNVDEDLFTVRASLLVSLAESRAALRSLLPAAREESR